jgi:hypothetical protein
MQVEQDGKQFIIRCDWGELEDFMTGLLLMMKRYSTQRQRIRDIRKRHKQLMEVMRRG